MEWVVELNGRKIKIGIAETPRDGVSGMILIDGQPVTMRWHEGTRTAFFKERGADGLFQAHSERCISLRDWSVRRDAQQSETIVSLEWKAHHGVRNARAVLNPASKSRFAMGTAKPKTEWIIRAPITGTVIKLLKQAGEAVVAGETLAVVEAMKMENKVRADHAGFVQNVSIREGQTVQGDDVIMVIGVRPESVQ